MKCGARVALGVAGGYFLGRTKKMKLALMLAGMAAGRQAGGPGALLEQGKKLLDASPELLRLTDDVKGRLLDAGKGAALAVATRQVEALTGRVAGRVENSLGNLADRGRGSRDSSGPADEDVTDEDVTDEDVTDEDVADEDVTEEAADDREEAPAEDTDTDSDTDDGGEGRATSDDGADTNSAPVRRGRRTGGAAAATKSGTRTATRRTSAASGTRRTAEKAAGRPARARRRNDNG